MKKNVLLIFLCCTPYLLTAKVDRTCKKEVRQVFERVLPGITQHIILEEIPDQKECDVFEQQIVNDKLIIKGSSGVALARGFYDFLRKNELGQIGWSGSRIEWPESLSGLHTNRVVSPVEHHYYYNVVTYGYSMPYWTWERWSQEIDWMALHGIDMPLALVANEAISTRVWKKLGLTDQEIGEYLVGPAHFPWMRMGNISGIDSPLPQQWHKDQIALQHQILKRMRNLGMTPICPGFAGFVPKAIQRLYPDLKIVETSWNVFHNWMISPQEDLFEQIGKMFIEEWEKEFGKNTHYLVDSFNEMDVPFPPKGTTERSELLASYGDKVYRSIKAGNPDATWVMQGWMFGYQRYIWDYETLQALVSKVPDNKMLLLDLAADYNANFWKNTFNWDFYKGFFNKNWVYSVIPNMGGKTGFTGILDFYANGHLEALNSPNRGNLQAIGMAPEGIENNEVLYELFTDAAWGTTRIDVKKWLESYSKSRYGVYNEDLSRYWDNMLASVYGSFTDHPRFNWQTRPGTAMNGTMQINDAFFKAFEAFASCADKMQGNELYQIDLRENMAMYLSGKLEILVQAISQAYLNNEKDAYDALTADFERIMLSLDSLLAGHPTLNLNRWIDYARAHSEDATLQDYYEKNARRIVTVWGPPVDDYATKIWGGLIRDYYLPRWKAYFNAQREGKPYQIASWELDWVENKRGTSPVVPFQTESQQIDALVASVSYITPAVISTQEPVLTHWSEADFIEEEAVLTINVTGEQLKEMKGLRFSALQGDQEIVVNEVRLIADGTSVFQDYPVNTVINNQTRHRFIPIVLPQDVSGNNGCECIIKLKKNTDATQLRGKIVLLTH